MTLRGWYWPVDIDIVVSVSTPGRPPASGGTARIGGTMAPFQAGPLRDRVLAYADAHGIGIAEALRRLIAAGLDSKEQT